MVETGKLRGPYKQVHPGNPAVLTVSGGRPELVVCGIRDRLTPSADGLMG